MKRRAGGEKLGGVGILEVEGREAWVLFIHFVLLLYAVNLLLFF
jgi:hypothetical protein